MPHSLAHIRRVTVQSYGASKSYHNKVTRAIVVFCAICTYIALLFIAATLFLSKTRLKIFWLVYVIQVNQFTHTYNESAQIDKTLIYIIFTKTH